LSDYCGWGYTCLEAAAAKSGLGAGAWVLISILAASAVYLTYRFVKQRRAGYTEVANATMDV
jgi:hypothetical protein